MLEAQGNVWDFYGAPDTVIVIPTNGDVNRYGECVMGRGLALQAKKRIKGIARRLGDAIREFGSVPLYLDDGRCLSFPVKHHWPCHLHTSRNAQWRERNRRMSILPHNNFVQR